MHRNRNGEFTKLLLTLCHQWHQKHTDEKVLPPSQMIDTLIYEANGTGYVPTSLPVAGQTIDIFIGI